MSVGNCQLCHKTSKHVVCGCGGRVEFREPGRPRREPAIEAMSEDQLRAMEADLSRKIAETRAIRRVVKRKLKQVSCVEKPPREPALMTTIHVGSLTGGWCQCGRWPVEGEELLDASILDVTKRGSCQPVIA